MVKAVVFDFYGTLAETRDWGPSWEELIAEMGYELDPDLKERWWNDGIDGIEHDEHSRSREHYVAWQQSRVRRMLDEYVQAAGDVYTRMLETDEARVLIRIEAAYQTMPGAGRHPEVTLMQKVHDMDGLVTLLTTDLPEAMTRPGTWMHEALQYRDRWRSKLLRTATWSPVS